MLSIPTRKLPNEVELSGTSSSVTITVDTSGLPFTARHLVVQFNARASSSTPEIKARFNSDSGSNYNRQMLRGQSSTAAALRASGEDGFIFGSVVSTANVFSSGELLIPDAFSTRSHKSLVALSGPAETEVTLWAGRWADISAITSVTLVPSTSTFAAGSTFKLLVVDERYAIPGAEKILT